MTRALIFLGLCSIAVAQPAAVDWRFAHPDADMKLGINLKSVLNSSLVTKAIEQAKAQAKDNGPQIDLVLGMVRTIDEVSVSLHQKGPNDADVLAELSGANFSPQLIAAFFPATGKAVAKPISAHTLLIGEGDSFTQAMERTNAGAPIPGDDLQQNDIWLDVGPALLAQQDSNPQLPPFLKGIKGVALGLMLSDSPKVDIAVTAADSASAGTMMTALQQLAPMLAASAGGAGANVAPKFQQDGSRVKMQVTIPPELITMLQQQAASGTAGAMPGLPPQLSSLLSSLGLGGGAKPDAKPPAPQDGGKVIIYGLDGGPKEIPAK